MIRCTALNPLLYHFPQLSKWKSPPLSTKRGEAISVLPVSHYASRGTQASSRGLTNLHFSSIFCYRESERRKQREREREDTHPCVRTGMKVRKLIKLRTKSETSEKYDSDVTSDI